MRAALITIFSVIFIDQFVKLWIKSNALLHEVVGSFGFIKFHFIENPGMAFGINFDFKYTKLILTLFRLFASVAIGMYLKYIIAKNFKGIDDKYLKINYFNLGFYK